MKTQRTDAHETPAISAPTADRFIGDATIVSMPPAGTDGAGIETRENVMSTNDRVQRGPSWAGLVGAIMAGFAVPCAALVALAFGGLTATTVLAQDATPVTGEAVDPAECRIEPRTLESLAQLLGTPTAGEAGAGAETAASPPAGQGEGEPADDRILAAVTATYRELVACLNAGDFPRAYALYTPGYVRQNLGERGGNIDDLAATPMPVDERSRLALVDVRDVAVLDNGRIAAVAEIYDPTLGGNVLIFSTLVPTGDRYAIEAETVLEAAPATPGP